MLNELGVVTAVSEAEKLHTLLVSGDAERGQGMTRLRAVMMKREDALILALRDLRAKKMNDQRKADVWIRGMMQTATKGEAGENVPRLTIVKASNGLKGAFKAMRYSVAVKLPKPSKSEQEKQDAEVNRAIATLQAALSLDFGFTEAQIAALREVAEYLPETASDEAAQAAVG